MRRIEKTDPVRPPDSATPKKKQGIARSLLKKLSLILAMITATQSTASYARAADDPALIELPELTYPTEPTEPEIAKFLNRCVDYEAAAIATVNSNNAIWVEHEKLVVAEAYNEGLNAAVGDAPTALHWVAIIGGSVAIGIVTGIIFGVMVAK